MKIKKILSLIVILALMISLCPVSLSANAIEIRTLSDLESLSEKCRTDTWSQGKTVVLLNDLDVAKASFLPIPTFGGHFDGRGHTLRGLSITNKGSYQGLFRYIQKGAVVEALNVRGTVKPDGTRKNVGGICGELSGTVKNCSFEGAVDGEVNAGGLAGSVTESGVIEDCRFSGTVTAKNYAGGIAGNSAGQIVSSENHGSINTTDKTAIQKKNVADIDLSLKDENIRKVENFDLCTDSGGIAGYSNGKVLSCKNYGIVGCESIGYNIGGICGRQSGYISGCENYGSVYGRKDVGGIVGQAEPYVLIEFSEDVLSKIQNELEAVQAIVDDNLNNADNEISDKLDDIDNAMTGTRDSVNTFSDNALDYADEMAERINDLSDRLHRAVVDSEAVFDDISYGAEQIADGLEFIADCGEYIESIADEIDSAADDADKAGDSLSSAGSSFENASDKLSDAVSELRDAADSIKKSSKNLKTAVKNLSDALDKKAETEKNFEALWRYSGEFAEAIDAAGSSMGDIRDALDEILADSKVSKAVKKAVRNIGKLVECYHEIGNSIGDICDALLLMAEDFDIYAVSNSLKLFERGFNSLSAGFGHLQDAIDGLDPVIDSVKNVSELAKEASSLAEKGIDKMSGGADSLKDAMDKLEAIANHLTEDGEIHLPSASDYMEESIEQMSDTVKAVQDEFAALNDIVKEKKNNAVDDLQRVSGRFDAIADILEDAYDNYLNSDKDEMYEDVSDSYSGGIWGRIEKSKNAGKVKGDLNSGGIIGSMAIEYDFDPEDDITNDGEKTLKFKYKTKCVVLRCVNEKSVTSKRSCAGGIVGKMDLGSVLSCEGYGRVYVSDGNYAGGIAGQSTSSIKGCAVKCSVSGSDYVGGIAGEGSDISGCRALINIEEYGEYGGSIAGCGDKNSIRGNFFIGDVGGIDNISYSGCAEETDIESFISFVKTNFDKGVTFELKFVADGIEVSSVKFNYGDKIDRAKIPKVPDKEGYYGKWSAYDYENARCDAEVEAEYFRDVEIISSDVKRDSGGAVVIICGAFDDTAKVTAVKKETDGLDCYGVKVENTYNKSYRVRYLPLKKNSAIYVSVNGQEKKVKTEPFANYLEFEVSGSEFDISERQSTNAVLLIVIIIILLTAAAVILIVKIIKKKKAFTPGQKLSESKSPAS